MMRAFELGTQRWVALVSQPERAEGESDGAWAARMAAFEDRKGLELRVRLVDLETRIRWGSRLDLAFAAERARLRARQKAGEDVDALGPGYSTPELQVDLLAAQREVVREACTGLRGPASIVRADGTEVAVDALAGDDLVRAIESLSLLGDVAHAARAAQFLTARQGES